MSVYFYCCIHTSLFRKEKQKKERRVLKILNRNLEVEEIVKERKKKVVRKKELIYKKIDKRK